MNAIEIKEWTKEHEEARQVFMEKYILPNWHPSMERRLLRELIWEKALKDGHLVWVPEGERKAHFKYKELAY